MNFAWQVSRPERPDRHLRLERPFLRQLRPFTYSHAQKLLPGRPNGSLFRSTLGMQSEPEHFFARNPGLHQLVLARRGMLEIRNQHPIKLPVGNPSRRRHRAGEERTARISIDESDAVDVHFAEREIRQFCEFACAIDRNPLAVCPVKRRQHFFQSPAHVTVVRERILHVLIGEP